MATNAVVRPTRSETMPHTIRPSALNTASQPTTATPRSKRSLARASPRVAAPPAAFTSCSPAKPFRMPITIRPAMAPLKNISQSV